MTLSPTIQSAQPLRDHRWSLVQSIHLAKSILGRRGKVSISPHHAIDLLQPHQALSDELLPAALVTSMQAKGVSVLTEFSQLHEALTRPSSYYVYRHRDQWFLLKCTPGYVTSESRPFLSCPLFFLSLMQKMLFQWRVPARNL